MSPLYWMSSKGIVHIKLEPFVDMILYMQPCGCTTAHGHRLDY